MGAVQRRRSITQAGRQTFLDTLAAGWTVAHAAERAGFGRQRFYELRDADEGFAAEWQDALEKGTQKLEDELHRRAVEGWDEDVLDGDGQLVRRVRRYSPALLIFSLKARNPEKYRDTVKVEGGAPITFVLESLLERAQQEQDAIDGEIIGELDEGAAS